MPREDLEGDSLADSKKTLLRVLPVGPVEPKKTRKMSDEEWRRQMIEDDDAPKGFWKELF